MAELARAHGVEVEVATFEAWEPIGRSFDAVVAGQSWHWVDPTVGTAKAARLLRPSGVLALFGHVFEPPGPVAEAYADAFHRVAPASPFGGGSRRPVETYQAMYATFADRIRKTGEFDEPASWRFDWEQPYSRDEWLDLLRTTGGLTPLSSVQVCEVLESVGSAIDALGGCFTMAYTAVAVVAVRTVRR